MFNKINKNLIYLASINGGKFPNVKSTTVLLGRLAEARHQAEKALIKKVVKPEPLTKRKRKVKVKKIVHKDQNPLVTIPEESDSFNKKILKLIKSHYKKKADMKNIIITQGRSSKWTVVLRTEGFYINDTEIGRIMVAYNDWEPGETPATYDIILYERDGDGEYDEFEVV